MINLPKSPLTINNNGDEINQTCNNQLGGVFVRQHHGSQVYKLKIKKANNVH